MTDVNEIFTPQQLLLPIQGNDEFTLDTFCFNQNQLLKQSIDFNTASQQSQFYYIHSPHRRGKTHLLKGYCHQFMANSNTCCYLSFNDIKIYPTDILDNLEQQSLICLDDLDAISHSIEWQKAIFDLYNRIREKGNAICMMTSKYSPNGLNLLLPDLQSRLSWGEVHQLNALNDVDKRWAIKQRCQHWGIQISDETIQFLMHRTSREIAKLIDRLRQLEQLSLSEKRDITIPFIKKYLSQ